MTRPLPLPVVLLVVAAAAAAPARAETLEDKLQLCGSCHGDDGKPADATIPTIWGQTEYFMVKQLHDFRSGDRDSSVMSAFARRLTQAELRPAAAALSKRTWPARDPAEAAAAAPPAPDGIAVCQMCHQKNFVGGLPAPRLAGQSYEYLVTAMRSFADGERTNNADMVKIMQDLSPEKREEIARYIAGL